MLLSLLRQTEHNRKVVCITGGIGQGKTVSMSVVANHLNDFYKSPVYSNYGLKNSLPLKEVTQSEQVKIICIDEFEDVLQWSEGFINTLLSDPEQETIFIFTAFHINRLPAGVKKKVDIFLEVEKSDSDTVKIKGINNDYEHDIFILDGTRVYNAFEPAELAF